MRKFLTEVPADDAEFLRHLIEAEGRSIAQPDAYAEQVKDRLQGRILHRGDKLPWVKTNNLIGLRPKEVSIWAGINGHGKSAVVNQVIAELMKQGRKVWLASLEMPVAATLERMVRQASGVAAPSEGYTNAFLDWSAGKLWLHNHVGRETAKKIVAMVRYVREKTGCQHYVIDSMMRVIRGTEDYSGQKDLVEMLCAAAHDLDVHVHLVAHSRKRETEMDHIDKFDIKGASEIADQADNVFTVWRNKRKEQQLLSGQPDGRIAREPDTLVTCAKQRHGDWEGPINLWYDAATKTYHETDARQGWSVSFRDMGVEEHTAVPF